LKVVEQLAFRNIALTRGHKTCCCNRRIPGAEPVFDGGRGVAAMQAIQTLWQGHAAKLRRYLADIIHEIAIGDHRLGVLEREVGPTHSRPRTNSG
jgi:hypothetical protein